MNMQISRQVFIPLTRFRIIGKMFESFVKTNSRKGEYICPIEEAH